MENDNLIVTKIKTENYRIYNKKGNSLRVDYNEALEAMAYSPNYWVRMEKVDTSIEEPKNLQGENL